VLLAAFEPFRTGIIARLLPANRPLRLVVWILRFRRGEEPASHTTNCGRNVAVGGSALDSYHVSFFDVKSNP
jgi:hypothetical protein